MKNKNSNGLAGGILYCEALDAIIELSNTTQEYFKQHSALIDYKLLMVDSNLEDAFQELSRSGKLLGEDIVKDIPEQYCKIRLVLNEVMRNASTKQECFASYFKSAIEGLGLSETRDKISTRLIELKLTETLPEENKSPVPSNNDSDVDWWTVKEYYKDVKRYTSILAFINAMGKINTVVKNIAIYDYYLTDDEHNEFIELLNKATNKICKAKSFLYKSDSDIMQMPSDLRYEMIMALTQLPDKIWQRHLRDKELCNQDGNLYAFGKDMDDLGLVELREKLKKFLIEKYVEEGRNG